MLSEVRPGERVVVTGADVDSETTGRRLLELGFVPGTVVTVERRAPLGDPTVYVLRGTRIALRKTAARTVRVEPLPENTP